MASVLLQCLRNLLLHPLSILFLVSVIFLYKMLWTIPPSSTNNLPPSPPKLPVIGNLHQLGRLPHRSLRSLSQQYGKFMWLVLGSKPSLVVSSADAAQEILKTHDVIFANRPKSLATSRIFYNCKDVAFCPYGEYWRQMKSICVIELLSNKKVRSFRTIREEEAGLMVEKIKKFHSSVVNLSEIIVTLTKDVTCRATFGRKYNVTEGGTNFKELLDEFTKVLGVFSLGDYIPWLRWIDQVRGLEKQVENVAKQFDDFLEKVVGEHQNRSSTKKHIDDDEANEGKNILDILLQVQTEKKAALPRDSVKAVVLDMFAAGTQTTYTLLEWVMTELLRHPRIMKELQEEVRNIGIGKAKICEDDLAEMKYLKLVIKETLRLHPPAPLLVLRETLQDVKINGYDIAKGTLVIINAWAIQTDPTFWEEPEEFRPERFLSSSVDFRGKDFQFIPFGAGKRCCPGISFGLANAELITATLLYEFDWKLPNGAKTEGINMDEKLGLTICRQHPLMLIATPYSR